MSKTTITAADVNDPDSPLIGAVILEGEDRPVRRNPGEEIPMSVKSTRVPLGMYEAVMAVDHPDGFSGVVREALAEWLERHTGAKAETAEVLAAIAVLNRAAGKLAAAELSKAA